ncbi:MAG: outer membrane protein assembly factor BamA [Planctomycetota bacterium]
MPRLGQSINTQRFLTLCVVGACLLVAPVAFGQDGEPVQADQADQAEDAPAAEPSVVTPRAGLPVVQVRVVGNERVGDRRVLNAVRTSAGDPFDAFQVEADVRRIFALNRFSRVEARYVVLGEGDDATVEVVFEVEELAPAGELRFINNRRLSDERLRRIVELESGYRPGERGDETLLALAADAVEQAYRQRNYALATVSVRRDEETDAIIFDVTEGPFVAVVNIDFIGATSFTERQLKRQVGTSIRGPFGLFGFEGIVDQRQLDADVASLQRFYRADKGFFDARIGRRLVWSPARDKVKVEFLVDEGRRYQIGSIKFDGLEDADEAELRKAVEDAGVVIGSPYDRDDVRVAIRNIVRAYVPLSRVYSPPPPGIRVDPDHLNINPITDFRLEPGIVDLTFAISEGEPFKLGNIRIRGNDKTQDKVILRQFDLAPGDPYDSEAVTRGEQRLRGRDFFQTVRVTPIPPPPGFDPIDGEPERDLLIEVTEKSTALISFGGAINSNGGVFGNITYTQRNFDIFDFPESAGDIFGDAFQGAGQTFRAELQPGTVQTNATLSFFEPRLYDQNLGLGLQGFYRTILRREYRDTRGGGNVRFVPRVGRKLGVTIGLRGEDVRIFDVDDPLEDRAPEIVAGRGNTTLTSTSLRVSWTDIDRPITPTRGYSVDAGVEAFGTFGGPSFQRATAGANLFVPLFTDARERTVVFEMRGDAGAIFDDAPFFERFYAGGIGSVRGFRFRGISPRDGNANDAIGGDYSLTGSAAVGFPLYDETLRGVFFTDFGSVDSDARLTTMRVSAGFGFRIQLGALQNVPLAFDFAWPLNRRPEDDLQVFSFSLGIFQ